MSRCKCCSLSVCRQFLPVNFGPLYFRLWYDIENLFTQARENRVHLVQNLKYCLKPIIVVIKKLIKTFPTFLWQFICSLPLKWAFISDLHLLGGLYQRKLVLVRQKPAEKVRTTDCQHFAIPGSLLLIYRVNTNINIHSPIASLSLSRD